MAVLFDIQGVQSKAHGERGIARDPTEGLARALEQECPGAVSTYLLNPDLPLPGTIEPIAESGRIDFSDRVDFERASVYHVGSLFEYEAHRSPLAGRSRARGAAVRGHALRLDPGDLLGRVSLRPADSHPLPDATRDAPCGLIACSLISEATARDARELLRISPDRIRVAGTGVSAHFVRPVSRTAAEAELRERTPLARPGFILYTGGIDDRKGIDRLLEAYAALPARLRARHQLIVVCRVQPAEAAALDRRLEELGISADVHFPGFVPDEELGRPRPRPRVFSSFPRSTRGLGCPWQRQSPAARPRSRLERRRSSSLWTTRKRSSSPPIPRSIRDAIENALEDEELLGRLSEKQLHERHTWAEVARRTASAYDELRGGTRRRVGRSRRIALAPPAPAAAGVRDRRVQRPARRDPVPGLLPDRRLRGRLP